MLCVCSLYNVSRFIQVALGETGLNCVWPWHMSLINCYNKKISNHLWCVYGSQAFPFYWTLFFFSFAVEQPLVFTLAKHETKQSHWIIHFGDKYYILTAVQQVLLTTAWFCSKLYRLDKHSIMKIRAILSTSSWQTTFKYSHLPPGHSKQLQTPAWCLIHLVFGSCFGACKEECASWCQHMSMA